MATVKTQEVVNTHDNTQRTFSLPWTEKTYYHIRRALLRFSKKECVPVSPTDIYSIGDSRQFLALRVHTDNANVRTAINNFVAMAVSAGWLGNFPVEGLVVGAVAGTKLFRDGQLVEDATTPDIVVEITD